MTSQTPIEDAIRKKLTEGLKPLTLEIYNNSNLHKHHEAMAGSTSKETHFRVVITSEAFVTKLQAARHRMVYNILKDELAQDGGIHALQLKTLTPEDAGFTQEKGEPALGVEGAGAANAYTA